MCRLCPGQLLLLLSQRVLMSLHLCLQVCLCLLPLRCQTLFERGTLLAQLLLMRLYELVHLRLCFVQLALVLCTQCLQVGFVLSLLLAELCFVRLDGLVQFLAGGVEVGLMGLCAFVLRSAEVLPA